MPMGDQIDDDHSSPVQPADQDIVSKRDYINVSSHPSITKILRKQGSFSSLSTFLIVPISLILFANCNADVVISCRLIVKSLS
jgi:hypothetical protein